MLAGYHLIIATTKYTEDTEDLNERISGNLNTELSVNKWLKQIQQEEIKKPNIILNQPFQKHIIYQKEQYGDMGKPVELPKDLSPEIQKIIDDGWRKNSFNQYVSDLISVKRSLPDPRDEWCTYPYRYNVKLPKTSVIICFYNEAWSVLLRTVHSILNRSPPNLIQEIILIDDFSDMDHLKQPLVDYWANEYKVRIIRNKKREGLIRARLIGTAHAKGEVLTFLDSHIEVAPGWLEPLLDRINTNYTTVVCPVIDTIKADTFEYAYGNEVFVGGFDWNLLFSWHSIPERENKNRFNPAEPVNSPTMAGGLFSISKKFFEELGTYDEGFEVWGAENLELSFKTWMCGGTLEIIPCSHVGHVFRDSFPYGPSKNDSNENYLRRNLRRLAEVWLDDYKKYHYQRRGEPDVPMGDITERIKLRKNLGCKSFKWFIDNVYPELFIPEFIKGYGMIGANQMCLDNWVESNDIYQPITLKKCYSTSLGGSQFWYYSDKNEIRKEEYCVDYSGDENKGVRLYPCHGNYGTQQWDYQQETGFIINPLSQRCLKVSDDMSNVEVKNCDSGDVNQRWIIENVRIG